MQVSKHSECLVITDILFLVAVGFKNAMNLGLYKIPTNYTQLLPWQPQKGWFLDQIQKKLQQCITPH